MQLEDLINKKYTTNKGCSPIELNKIQRENHINFPSDLVFLFLETNGLEFSKDYQISLDKENPIVSMDDIYNLEWIITERKYDIEDESVTNYTDSYLKIASTYNQDRILIGIEKNNVNQIFLYSYDNDDVLKICDSLFDFFNEHLI